MEELQTVARVGRQPHARRRPTASKPEPPRALIPYTVTCGCGERLVLAFAWSAVTCGSCGEKLSI